MSDALSLVLAVRRGRSLVSAMAAGAYLRLDHVGSPRQACTLGAAYIGLRGVDRARSEVMASGDLAARNVRKAFPVLRSRSIVPQFLDMLPTVPAIVEQMCDPEYTLQSCIEDLNDFSRLDENHILRALDALGV